MAGRLGLARAKANGVLSKQSAPALSLSKGRRATMFYVYILKCFDGSYYIGHTEDVETRVEIHNAGRGAAYTRVRRPVVAVYREWQPDEGSAVRRELQIKNWSRAKKEALIRGDRDDLRRLSHL